ncbi:MAG: lytic murein transglycosylase [Candidatus Marinimicrobia bacterium]|jgi:membrane-bound lytic murein transglycosylase B|nr:lytic murein transglycosylase [Candidatus Neomarinimicrobiota bacterium]|tara:strand:- start:147 stop:1034 length:888 start_codon:yes stop_codon:yes gene_type:complete
MSIRGEVRAKRYIVTSIILLTSLSLAQDGHYQEWSTPVERELVELVAENDLSRRIYGEVVASLRDNDVAPDFVYRTFTHPDIFLEDEVVRRFTHPAETYTYERYRKIFITDDRIFAGAEFFRTHTELIRAVQDRFGVDPFLLLSIIGVESEYGRSAKKFVVFNALHTVIHRIPKKERWVEREMTEYLLYCYHNFVPPLTLYGSYAGAFGYGQFIPSSFNHYAVDFDGDGVRHPFKWPDALGSIANYLVKNGYDRNSSSFVRGSRNWKSILAYNPSYNYARVVVELREAVMAATAE